MIPRKRGRWCPSRNEISELKMENEGSPERVPFPQTLPFPEDPGLVSNARVYPYSPDETPDGLEGSERSFPICTFRLGEALARASDGDPSRGEDDISSSSRCY